LQLAGKGLSVTFVDASERALAQVKSNAARNGVEKECEYKKTDVFTFLKEELEAGSRYDFIVLDPPLL